MHRSIFGILVLAAGWCCPCLALAQEPLPPAEERQIKGILAALDDEYPVVRTLALAKLARLFETDGMRDLAGRVRGKLVLLLRDETPNVRLMAAGVLALGKQVTPEVIEKLAALLADEDPRVQAQGAQALGRLSKEAPGLVTKFVPTVVPNL